MRKRPCALLALTDRVVAACRTPGDTSEIARRVGTVACYCTTQGRPGVTLTGDACATCTRRPGATPGWRPATPHEVYTVLAKLERHHVVAGERPNRRTGRTVTWTLLLQPSPITVPEP